MQCHGLDDAKQSEDEVRDDPEHEAHDGPEEEQALGSATQYSNSSSRFERLLVFIVQFFLS